MALLALGCYASYQSYADTEQDGRIDVDAVRDVDGGGDVRTDGDVGVDMDAHADAEADVDADSAAEVCDAAGACDGAWRDPTTGYLWENPPSSTFRDWDDGIAYCNGLTLCACSPGSWHLPTISELRSLIRHCSFTVTGSPCTLTDSCSDESCESMDCGGCIGRGPPLDPLCYYWDDALGTDCGWYWSSSHGTDTSRTWGIYFDIARATSEVRTLARYVRCVRRGS